MARTKTLPREELLKAIQSIRYRAEKQDGDQRMLQNLVRIIDFEALASANTQIVYGRNGTGKTHLLRAFRQHCEDHYRKTRVLPVYIDFKDLELGPVLPTVPVPDLLLRFYKLFMRKIVERLREFSNSAITVSVLERIFGGEGRDRQLKLRKSFEALDAILNLRHIEERVKEYAHRIEVETDSTTKAKAGVEASAGLSAAKTSAKIGLAAGISTEEIEKQKDRIEVLYQGLAVINYEGVRQELEQIISLTGARAIVILADEWSSVSLSIQPLLADMILKTLGVSKRIFLKIASLKYLTRLSATVDAPQRIGFQVGIDAHVLEDLDALLNYDADSRGVQTFLSWVAYRHTCVELEALRRWSAPDFEEFLCSEIFQDAGVYGEVVRASEGNPRDFLALLSSCAAGAKINPDARISSQQVIKAAAKYFNDTKLPELRNSPQAEVLFKKLFQQIVKNRQKLFLVSADKAASDVRLQELWHYRFIHLVEPTYTVLDEEGTAREYAVYSMDYSRLLGLKVDAAGEQLVRAMDSVVNFLGGGSILSRILEATGITRGFKQFAGETLVAQMGIETADINTVRRLASENVVDRIL